MTQETCCAACQAWTLPEEPQTETESFEQLLLRLQSEWEAMLFEGEDNE